MYFLECINAYFEKFISVLVVVLIVETIIEFILF